LDLLIKKMAAKPESKSLIVNLLHPQGCALEADAKITNTACMASVHFILRPKESSVAAKKAGKSLMADESDLQCDMHIHFRSQNAFLGGYANFWSVRQWEKEIVDRYNEENNCQIAMGKITVYIDAAHVYEKDYKEAKMIRQRHATE